ncbi:putative RNA methyltransferase [Bacillus sp. B15-48]|uniref:putative RNA methyltransferase n=1 Tax=Bacillus sp. B15-48 TaxID=1548601 RepID=UPI00193EF9A5|nr:SAM-dependent methyltransferase [Bacillus sp. B15-48]MBM4765417.1 SAM-dependent methyltransferase [Bacillus sp. B15-48]
MTNKEKSAILSGNFENIFRCPYCENPMKVTDSTSLKCSNNHTFDFAKQGYINMMTRSVNSHYDKSLFEARKKIIMESDLYDLLHEKVSEGMNKYVNEDHDSIMIFDAGCGEGSHLHRILQRSENDKMQGVGLDIAKEGIMMGAKNYRECIWLVGDLAQSPLANQSCHVILNILSPANYLDFKRILVPNGLVVKVVPRANYLKELREILFDQTDKQSYRNDETVNLFKENFHLIDKLTLNYQKQLSQSELMNLVQMSPLAWNANEESIVPLLNQGSAQITIDLEILIGRKI